MGESARIHPFAPADQTRGYDRLLKELAEWLSPAPAMTCHSSPMPDPGEYAGLLAIRRYHQSRGESHRDQCLIPASAHGTNPASAIMAGMQVQVVACDDRGDVDMDDLRAKVTAAGSRLAAIMVTYPSTHGVFEESIVELCQLVHEHGGQVYVDGANLNALIGLAAPGKFGADVSHLNLHKTFCIPHGGGGPGMGPIGVGEHLAEFLPCHPVTGGWRSSREADVVAAAAFGSASILPITWAYIAMMGAQGLTHASKVAILSANYIAHRLEVYDILYRGRNSRVTRVHHRHTPTQRKQWHIGGGRREATDRLRVPRAHHVVSGIRHPDD